MNVDTDSQKLKADQKFKSFLGEHGKNQAWILAPDIGQCPTRTWVMPNEGY